MSAHKVFLYFLLTVFSLNGLAKKIDFITLSEISEWENLVNVCAKKNKPIFLMLSEFHDKDSSILNFNKKYDVKFVHQNFVSVRVNTYSNLGKTFISLFGLNVSDKFLIFNPQEIILLNGKSISKKWFEKGLSRFNNYNHLIKQYETQELTQLEWLDYLDISFYNLGYSASLRDAYRFTLTLNDEDLKNPELWNFILNYCTDINNVVFKTIYKQPKLVENSKEKFPWKEYYANCFNLNLDFAINNKDSLRMVRITKELVPHYPDSNKKTIQKLLVEQQYFGHLNQWKYYEEITYDFLLKYANDSAEYYLKEASKLYENFSFTKVENLIIKLLKDGIDIESTYDLQMSLANIYILEQDYTLALKHAKLAMGTAKTGNQRIKAVNMINYLKIYGGY